MFTAGIHDVCVQIDDDNSGHIDLQELNKALQLVGIRIPGYELRDLVAAADREKDDKINLDEFQDVRTYYLFLLSAVFSVYAGFVYVYRLRFY